MLHKSWIRVRCNWTWGLVLAVLAGFPSPGAAGQGVPVAMQSTAKEAPAAVEEAWEKASAKYKPQREALLEGVKREIEKGPFRADWESLSKYETPDWYKDAKLGIFIHWGVYSVPAFGNEWYPRNMYREGSDEYKHHLATYGPLTKFGYKDFIPMFRAEQFDPKAWAALFKESGAQYVVPVFEHHDGFAMYDNGLSDWTAVKMGPKRDLWGDLAKEVKAQGMHLGASSHRIEHDFFLGEGRKLDSDVNDPKYAAFYGPAHNWWEGKPTLLEDWTYLSNDYLEDWVARNAEIVEKYNPEIMYFDWWIGQPGARKAVSRFAAFYYNHAADNGKVPVINYKLSAMEPNSAVLDIERGQLSQMRKPYWQTDTSISNKSWGYIENDNFKSPQMIIHQLADIVSKNGNLLLNIGPRSNGTIPDEVQSVLREIGAWLKVNGEAIYGTRAWNVFGEGPTKVADGPFHDSDAAAFTDKDFRFTSKGNNLYAIELGWPTTGESVIQTLNEAGVGNHKIEAVTLLGYDKAVPFQVKPDGLHIQVPAAAVGKYAYCFRVVMSPAAP
jgi:alpha-L-fucosidase